MNVITNINTSFDFLSLPYKYCIVHTEWERDLKNLNLRTKLCSKSSKDPRIWRTRPVRDIRVNGILPRIWRLIGFGRLASILNFIKKRSYKVCNFRDVHVLRAIIKYNKVFFDNGYTWAYVSLVPRPFPAFQCCTLKSGRCATLKTWKKAPGTNEARHVHYHMLYAMWYLQQYAYMYVNV